MRLGGLVLYLLFLVPSVAAFLVLPLAILAGPRRMKEALRAVDQFNNAFWLNGAGRESVSSHAWRARGAWWADFVIRLTDAIQAGHCREANRHEQPVQDFIEEERNA